jgi:hypothetical protein
MKTLATYLSFAALLLAASVSKGAEPSLWMSRPTAEAAEYPQPRFQEMELSLAIEDVSPQPRCASVGVNDSLRPGADQFAAPNLFDQVTPAGQTAEQPRIELSAATRGAFNPGSRVNVPLRCSGLSPYLYAGDRQREFNLWNWMTGGGLGLEYRLAPLSSIFVDGRFSWADRSLDNERMLVRGGINIGF